MEELLDALATWRLTRLITTDQITAGLRERIWKTHSVEHGLGYLVTCPYCSSLWLAAAAVVARQRLPRLWKHAARALALSAVAGEISARVD